MNSETDELKPFEFKSTLYKYFLWITLLLVLLSDVLSIPNTYANRFEMSFFSLVFALSGIAIRIGLLVILLIKKGPIDVLVYVWGGTFIIGGSLGLISLFLSYLADSLEGIDSAPLVAYLDHSLILILGVMLVVPLRKCVAKT